MQPDESLEERLDTLLSQRQRDDGSNGPSAAGQVRPAGSDQRADAQEIDALLGAADRFAVWGGGAPSPAFADRLEAQLLARCAARPRESALHGLALTPPHSSVPRSDAPAQGPIGEAAGGAIEPGPAAPIPLHPRNPGMRVPRQPNRRLPGRHGLTVSRPPWQAIAAVLLIVGIGSGSIAVAAATGAPGQLLYALLQVEQGVRSKLGTSPAERVRLHLRNAQDALAAFDAAVANVSGEQAYRAALATFADEERAASTELAGVPAGAERDTLVTELAALRVRGRHDLHTALRSPALSWPVRADATRVLGQLGDAMLAVARASIAGTSHDGAYTWTITIQGTGFVAGAVVLVDGQPMGAILSRSATTIVAQIPGNALGDGAHSIGVGNPDGTAAVISKVTTNRSGDDHGGNAGRGGADGGGGPGSPTPPPTPDGDGHSGSGGGSGSSGGAGGSATPTPTPPATPDDHH